MRKGREGYKKTKEESIELTGINDIVEWVSLQETFELHVKA